MVDLSTGPEGIIQFRDGERWHCGDVRAEGGDYLVRFESGWRAVYSREGLYLVAGRIIHADGRETSVAGPRGRDIVEFVPCRWDDQRAQGLKGSVHQ